MFFRFLLIVILFSSTSVVLNGQTIRAYHLYDAKGKKVSYQKMIKQLKKQDVILFGELHNNAIAHWLQLKLIKTLIPYRNLALGAEMLEADNQVVLDAYLNGEINQQAFDSLARLWSNYKTDYKPLVDFAKENQLPFIATNIPRRYASLVYRHDFDTLNYLSEEEKAWIAPLPIPYDPELPSYKKMQTMMSSHPNENFPKAQAIKDATMANFIVDYFRNTVSTKKPLFIHFNGSYHSDFKEGIAWYLDYYFSTYDGGKVKKVATITTVEQEKVDKLDEEHKGKADFILVVDQDMTKTY